MVEVRTYDKLLDKLNVRTRLLGQVIVRLGGRGGLVPALELLVHDLAPLQQTKVGGEELDLLTGGWVLVCHGDLDLLEAVEHIELGEVERSVVVDGLHLC